MIKNAEIEQLIQKRDQQFNFFKAQIKELDALSEFELRKVLNNLSIAGLLQSVNYNFPRFRKSASLIVMFSQLQELWDFMSTDEQIKQIQDSQAI